jgi:L-ascorbate metabolism protein UlaG (beta-lactamase superfamily)
MQITWLGHGTFQFQLPTGEVIVMDPWIDGNPKYPATHQFQRVDAIVITHGHFDHIHDAIPLARKFSPQVVAIYEACLWLEGKGVKNTYPMNKGGSQRSAR